MWSSWTGSFKCTALEPLEVSWDLLKIVDQFAWELVDPWNPLFLYFRLCSNLICRSLSIGTAFSVKI